ncbi:hypothetical protein ARMGADRAFT_1085942 [Armillaria gallica]|uniref:Uncharacterized protein n=1 Tax=Armillaria gallica TaxID=47427 RepID=A0A2H3D0B1_ARMGA|nr:hypothetical protein ARMGADRAFT_1085942 [Armillaria gallica]
MAVMSLLAIGVLIFILPSSSTLPTFQRPPYTSSFSRILPPDTLRALHQNMTIPTGTIVMLVIIIVASSVFNSSSHAKMVANVDCPDRLHTVVEVLKGMGDGDTGIDKPGTPMTFHGWLSGCVPTSSAWKDHFNFTFNVPWPQPPPSTPKTFVFNNRNAMDPCLYSHLLRKHGQFLSFGRAPVPSHHMVLALTYSQTSLHHDITITHTVMSLQALYAQNSWILPPN